MSDQVGSESTRRSFVGVLGAAATAAVVLPVLTDAQTARAADDPWTPTVKPEELANGTFRLYRRNGFVLSRVDDKIYAISTKCTHQACDVQPGADSATKGLLVCKCHGGRYDGVGKVVQTPPKTPLAHHQARIGKDGVIEVHATAMVEGADAGLDAPKAEAPK
jgi:Rieske Fe-S protein